jgi:hypothetical protein
MSGIGGPQTSEEKPAAVARAMPQMVRSGGSPAAPPEADEHDKQAQEPALKLRQGLDFLADRAGARQLAKPARECLPSEPYKEQQGTKPEGHAE